VCQFYIFKVFDKNFKASLQDVKHRIFARKKLINARKSPNDSSTNAIELKNLANLIGNGLID
jgi:hypothetical protein